MQSQGAGTGVQQGVLVWAACACKVFALHIIGLYRGHGSADGKLPLVQLSASSCLSHPSVYCVLDLVDQCASQILIEQCIAPSDVRRLATMVQQTQCERRGCAQLIGFYKVAVSDKGRYQNWP